MSPSIAPIQTSRALLKTKTHVLQNEDLRSLLVESAAEDKARPTGTKVIVTIGPATHEVDTLAQLLEAGMSCARLDLTWGTTEYHSASLTNLEAARQRTGRSCAVMLDTLGRELTVRRSFQIDENGWPSLKQHSDIHVEAGQPIALVADPSAEASCSQLPISYPGLWKVVAPGDTLFVGRYLATGAESASLFLTVQQCSEGRVACVSKNSATLSGLMTLVHISEEGGAVNALQADLPLLAASDVSAIRTLGRAHAIDYVAVSYARNGDDLWEMRQFLDKHEMHNTKLICKLEHRAALLNLQSLAAAADGICLSRGNLGLDVPPEKVAMVQKHVIQQCNHLGKPVIVTRIVDTMVDCPRPTRAEATDVANAVLDGCDGVMLGAETLRGKYPVITVQTVLDISREAEAAFDHAQHYETLVTELTKDGGALGVVRAGSESDISLPSPTGTPSGSRANLSAFGSHAQIAGSANDLQKMVKVSSFGSLVKSASHLSLQHQTSGWPVQAPAGGSGGISMSKLEALASSAVRAVAKVQARLLICFGTTGRTASLLAKYRPPVPILTVVMTKAGVGDEQHAPYLSRQLNVMRGIVPLLAHPEAEENEAMLLGAVQTAVGRGFCKPGDQVVCVMAVKDSMVLKMVCVSPQGGLDRQASGSSLANLGAEAAPPLEPLCPVGSLP